MESGQADDIIDYDARLFFQFSTGTSKKDRGIRLKAMRDMGDSAAALGYPQAESMRSMTDFLQNRFNALFKEET